MWILWNFTYLCYLYNSSIDSESIDLMKKWIDEVKSMEKGILSEEEWKKSKMWIERCEMDLEMCELWRKWNANGGNEKNKYCEEQMEKLNNARDMGIQLNAKDMRRIWEAFGIKLNEYSSNKVRRENQLLYWNIKSIRSN